MVTTGDFNRDGILITRFTMRVPTKPWFGTQQQRLYRRGLWADYSRGLERGRTLISLLRRSAEVLTDHGIVLQVCRKSRKFIQPMIDLLRDEIVSEIRNK